MKTILTMLLLASCSASAVDVPVVTSGKGMLETPAVFSAVRITEVTLRRGPRAELSALTSYVKVGSVTHLVNGTNTVRAVRSDPVAVVLDEPKLAGVIPNFTAQKQAVLNLMEDGISTLTAKVDAAGRITAVIPTPIKGAYRSMVRDETWLAAQGVDCAAIRAGVRKLVEGLK